MANFKFIGFYLIFLISCYNPPQRTNNEENNNSKINTQLSKPYNLGRFYDTIIVAKKDSFRIFQDTTNKELRLKILKQNKNNWQTNIEEEWTSLYEFKDWNNDGYMDIILRYHHAFVIILYNPKKDKFVKFGDIGELTDKVEHIIGTNLVFNIDEHKKWNSELFDIDSNYNKRSYGIMFNWDDTNRETNTEDSIISVFKRLLIFNKDYYNNSDTTIMGTNKRLTDKIVNKSANFCSNCGREEYDSLRLNFVRNYWTNNWKKYKKS